MFKLGPLTSIVGIFILIVTWANQAFVEQGMPKDSKEWTSFLVRNATGLVALLAKDFNKSGTTPPTA